ncbi:hypothetical protein PITC_051050 [Penicillium italicum]|uniref:Uncharacterized protein n=1 Tax=Penicillium italicum TaxID=40296 RepID=A0A0A2KUH5_PENIT|nr:hypothetical protein PITC_051050 [Penicillium italicum]
MGFRLEGGCYLGVLGELGWLVWLYFCTSLAT